MRIARIARPGALRDASISAKTPEAIDEAIINPIAPDEIADANLAEVLETSPHLHIPGFGEFSRKSPMGVNRVNSI